MNELLNLVAAPSPTTPWVRRYRPEATLTGCVPSHPFMDRNYRQGPGGLTRPFTWSCIGQPPVFQPISLPAQRLLLPETPARASSGNRGFDVVRPRWVWCRSADGDEKSLWESWYCAECAPGRTQDERGSPKAMAVAPLFAPEIERTPFRVARKMATLRIAPPCDGYNPPTPPLLGRSGYFRVRLCPPATTLRRDGDDRRPAPLSSLHQPFQLLTLYPTQLHHITFLQG